LLGVQFDELMRLARLMPGLLSGVTVQISCHTSMALDINQTNEAELDSIKSMGSSFTAPRG
jgi:hypothetical protein